MSSTQTSSLIVRLLDQVTGPAAKMASSLRNLMSAANGKGSMPFGAKLTDAINNNNRALAASRGRLFDAAASAYTLKTALGAPLNAAVKFETALEDIRQKSGLTKDSFASLTKSITQIATATNNMPSQMSGGLDFLVGMGMNVKDALAILPDIGKTATAYNADITDLGKAGYAALENLKVPANKFALALDAMATAGNAGGFEIKNMAQYFPSLGASYQALKQTGVPAVADLAAALQIVRQGAGDAEEAARNLGNLLQKIKTPETIKKFKKLGIALEDELASAATRGLTPIEAITEITAKALKGNNGKIGYLFEDAQVQKALNILMPEIEKYRKIRAEAMAGVGQVEKDYAGRLETALVVQKQFNSTMERLQITVGNLLLPTFTKVSKAVTDLLNRFEAFSDKNKELIKNVALAVSGLVAFRIAAIGLRYTALLAGGALLNIAQGALFVGRALGGIAAILGGGTIAMFGRLAMAARAVALGFAINGAGAGLAAFGGVLAAIAAPAAAFVALAIGIGAAGYWIYNNWKSIVSFFESVGQGFTFGMKAAAPALEELSRLLGDSMFGKAAATAGKWLSQLATWLNNILGPVDANGQAWDGLGVRIGKGFAGWIVAAIGHVRDLIKFLGDVPAILSKTGAAITRAFTFSGGPGVSAGGATELGGGGGLDGARANGGPVKAGGNYLVGERGPELAHFPKAGTIIPNHALRGGGKAGDTTIAPTFNITVNGNADAGDIAQQIRRALREETQSLVRSTYSDVGFA